MIKREKQSTLNWTEGHNLLLECGINPDSLDPDFLLRYRIQTEESDSIYDAKITIELAKEFNTYLENCGFAILDDTELREIFVGLLLSDIGKTGPEFPEGMQETQKIQQIRDYLKLYSIKNIPNYESISLEDCIRKYFSEDKEMVSRFKAYGEDPSQSMRNFTNQHAHRSYKIACNSGIPEDTIPAIALHHIFEDQNPDNLVAEDGHFTRDCGCNTEFHRPELLVVILDKLNAVQTRLTPGQTAPSWLEATLLVEVQMEERIERLTHPELKKLLKSMWYEVTQTLHRIAAFKSPRAYSTKA